MTLRPAQTMIITRLARATWQTLISKINIYLTSNKTESQTGHWNYKDLSITTGPNGLQAYRAPFSLLFQTSADAQPDNDVTLLKTVLPEDPDF